MNRTQGRKGRRAIIICLFFIVTYLAINFNHDSSITEVKVSTIADHKSLQHRDSNVNKNTTSSQEVSFDYEVPSDSKRNKMLVPPSSISPNMVDFYNAISNDIPTYTETKAREATRPSSWQCSATINDDENMESHTIFAFVHIYKASGSSMRLFFHKLAYTCHKIYIGLARCTGVLPSSIKAGGPWKPCTIEELADGRRREEIQFDYPKQKNFAWPPPQINHELMSSIDVYAGHARIGTGDYILDKGGSIRYIVFLREPIERYVSSVLYMNKVSKRNETLEQTVHKIKKKIENDRQKDKYMDKSLSYLLTPSQRVSNNFVKFDSLRELVSSNNATNTSIHNISLSSFKAESRAKLAIWNLYQYNAIIGMTEEMSDSLFILRHIFLQNETGFNELNDEADEVFKKFGLVDSNGDNNSSSKQLIQANKSSKKDVSTSKVMAELRKSEEHWLLLEEFVKYERMISDFAWTMHVMQLNASL